MSTYKVARQESRYSHDFLMMRTSAHLSFAARSISGMTTRMRLPLGGLMVQVHSMLVG